MKNYLLAALICTFAVFNVSKSAASGYMPYSFVQTYAPAMTMQAWHPESWRNVNNCVYTKDSNYQIGCLIRNIWQYRGSSNWYAVEFGGVCDVNDYTLMSVGLNPVEDMGGSWMIRYFNAPYVVRATTINNDIWEAWYFYAIEIKDYDQG